VSAVVRLRDLEARFLRRFEQIGDCDPMLADGICFVCPLCYLANDRSVIGVHSIICWSPRVPLDVVPGPGRWELQGTSLDDVSLVAPSSSVKLEGGCAWHGFVRDGACVEDLTPERVEATRRFWVQYRQKVAVDNG
jgi:hypothetical protein